MTPRRLGALLCLMLVTAGCGGLRGVAVPELDALRLNRAAIHAGSTQDEVRALLGPPPFSEEDRVKIRWWYPVRVLTRTVWRAIPAAELKVWLDDAGRVDDWGFAHPVTGARLPIRETLAEADRWFGGYCNPPPRIELATVLRKGTAKADALNGMRWFPPRSSSFLQTVLVRSARERDRETLTFYADRPSPLYVPRFYLEVTFAKVALPPGTPRTVAAFQGTGRGCK